MVRGGFKKALLVQSVIKGWELRVWRYFWCVAASHTQCPALCPPSAPSSIWPRPHSPAGGPGHAQALPEVTFGWAEVELHQTHGFGGEEGRGHARCEATLRALGQDLEEGQRCQEALVPAGPTWSGKGLGVPVPPSAPPPAGSLGGLGAMALTPASRVCWGGLYTEGMGSWGPGGCAGGARADPPASLHPLPATLASALSALQPVAPYCPPSLPAHQVQRVEEEMQQMVRTRILQAVGQLALGTRGGRHHHPPSRPTYTRTPGLVVGSLALCLSPQSGRGGSGEKPEKPGCP